jgi:truncated hemoglobin YjbI
MSFRRFVLGVWVTGMAAAGCESTGAVDAPRLPPGAAPASPSQPRPAGGAAGAPSDALYRRLGGADNIRTVMTDFVGRAARDPKINGYFLNSTIDSRRIIECLVIQVSALTGGPFAYPSAGCRDMRTVHTRMGVSFQDFQDTAKHLVDALANARVSQADIAAIANAVNGLVGDIVEDPANNMTVYQRVGRKPAIEQVVTAFIQRVYNNPTISSFFGGGNPERLRTCLTRMVCGIDGPCKYGREVDGFEGGVGSQAPCKDMPSSHSGINRPRAITKADFDVLVAELIIVLDGAGVAAGDKMAILGALGPTCKDIVAGGVGCN